MRKRPMDYTFNPSHVFSNAVLMVVLGYFIRNWINGMRKDIDKKVNKETCDERHKDVDHRLEKK